MTTQLTLKINDSPRRHEEHEERNYSPRRTRRARRHSSQRPSSHFKHSIFEFEKAIMVLRTWLRVLRALRGEKISDLNLNDALRRARGTSAFLSVASAYLCVMISPLQAQMRPNADWREFETEHFHIVYEA